MEATERLYEMLLRFLLLSRSEVLSDEMERREARLKEPEEDDVTVEWRFVLLLVTLAFVSEVSELDVKARDLKPLG
jgi:Ca2+/H+ antiporter